MACARQLYLFSSLIGVVDNAEVRAAALFRSLQRHFHDAEHGGWFYSIDPQGKPLDQRKDLYTHAFILFACAHYWAKSAIRWWSRFECRAGKSSADALPLAMACTKPAWSATGSPCKPVHCRTR
jgi:hypothetical protein